MRSRFELDTYRRCIREGLRVLGVDNFFLQIHDPSFPNLEEEETARGSPYTRGAARFLKGVHEMGFNGLQLGPQGATSVSNPSPYDGTLFSRNPMSISLHSLCEDGLLTPQELTHWLEKRPPGHNRVHYGFAFDLTEKALRKAYDRFCRLREQNHHRAVLLSARLSAFRSRQQAWLEGDALYSVLRQEHGGRDWQQWVNEARQPDLDQWLPNPPPRDKEAIFKRREVLTRHYANALEYYAFVQLLAHEQHDRFRNLCGELGLQLYADLQVGMSEQDAWNHQGLFLDGYRLGAPPSRTNPEGQPWGFTVFDPRQYTNADGSPGPVLRFVEKRLGKIYTEYDGIRIDHPQGWVTPWVYRTDIANPFQAVQDGARLFSSPDLPDHPQLRQFSLVRSEQINRHLPRYADDWVNTLTEDQVTQYAALFAHLAPPTNQASKQVMCEVLSTMPYPLRRVMERYGLGRFRVLQNANPNDPLDVYRSDNAQPADWIMLGNHDTRPIWQLARHWCRSDQARQRANDLSRRLVPNERERPDWVNHIASQPGALVHALFADMLHSKARNIMVFVSDMLGIQERYNTPGTVSDENWSLRIPPDFEEYYLRRVAEDNALSLPYAMLLALKARPDQVDKTLLDAMERETQRLRAEGWSLARS